MVVPFIAVIKGAFVISSLTFLSKSFSNLKSLFVKIPISLSFSSTTGTPDILYSAIIASASFIFASGPILMGSEITPLSFFLTFFTSYT